MGRRVLAAGCFDLLHYGHLRYLEEAKRLGGEGAELVVVVARDSTILKRKGHLPVMNEEHRRELVEALKPVNRAVLGGTNFDIKSILEAVKPDVIALGYDQEGLAEILRKEGFEGEIVRLAKYGDISSSKIRALINPSECIRSGSA
ncbi:MAG: FAD synthase [Candidatus Verstraetearchaeota archaeon]|nr:FAD synthase [Candidatus Verstraetearchaeota archaeon]